MLHPKLLSSTGTRFTAIYFALYLVSTALMLSSIYWFNWSSTRDQLDSQIDDRIEWFTREFGNGGVSQLRADIGNRIRSQIKVRVFFRLTMGEDLLVGNLPAVTQPIQLGRQSLTVPDRLASTAPLELRARTESLGPLLLTVAIDSESLAETRQLFIRVAIGVLIGSLLVAPAIGYVMSRYLLNKLSFLNRTISSIMAGQLARRVDLRGSNDEFDQLGKSLNEMLDTIQRLMSDVRSIANNVAHDLRTPLGRLQMRLEELRDRSVVPGPESDSLNQAISECRSVIETFNAMLKIAEVEREQARANFAELSLSDVAATIAEAYSAAAEEEGRMFDVDIAADVWAFGDRLLLLQMLSNVVENAFKHTLAGTPVRMRLTREEGLPLLTVEDAGAGVPATARDRVFERFHRLEQSRTTPGSGLGLSLVSAIARLHNIRVTLEDAEPGLRVRLLFQPITYD